MQQGNGLQSPLRPLSFLFFHLLLAHLCSGQSELITPSQATVATVGDDIILPCHLKPEMDVVAMTLEWTRPDLKPIFVHVRRSGQDIVRIQHPSYTGRTSVSIDELKHGNVSLKLSKVKPSDAGRYQCYIPKLNTGDFVELVVGAASSLVISLSELNLNKGAVVLQCKSRGWYPEPEVFWLDGEGNLLSAGPTETVRGPDDLYTVSSRVTVEKRHSNSFTCSVQQNHINQIRETLIHVPDDFFKVLSSASSTIIGLAVSLAVCFLVILILGFFVWRQKKSNQTDAGEKKNLLKLNVTEDQFVTVEEPERQQLLTHETVLMKDLNKGQAAGIRPEEEKLRRREAEKIQKTLERELESMKTEIRKKQSDLQQLEEEKKKKEENVKRLKEHLENKNTEVKTLEAAIDKHSVLSSWFSWDSKKETEKKKMEAEIEVENLKKQLETEEKELDTKTKEFDDKQVEVQQLQEEIQKKETNLKSLTEKLENNKELERSLADPVQSDPVQSSSYVSKWPLVTRQRFQQEQQKLKEEQQKLKEEQQRREEVENKVQILEEELQKKTRELDGLKDEVNKLTEEKKRSEEERQKLQNKITQWENNFKEEEKKREKAEEQVTDLNTKFNGKQAEVQQLQEQIQKMESGLQSLMEDLQSDTLEISLTSQPGRRSAGSVQTFPLSGGNRTSQVQSVPLLKWPEMLRQKFQEKLQKKITELQEEHDRRDKAERDVLKKNKELQDKIQQKQAEVQQLQEQIQNMETDLQTLMKDLDSDNLKDLKKPVPSSKSTTSLYQSSQSVPVQSSSSLLKWPEMLRQKIQEKLQKKITEWENKVKEEEKKREKEVKELNIKMGNKEETIRKLKQEKQDKETELEQKLQEEKKKSERDQRELNDQLTEEKKKLQDKIREVISLTAEVNQLTEEKKRSEEERQKLQTEITELTEEKKKLQDKIQEVDDLNTKVKMFTEEKTKSETERQKLQNNITDLEKQLSDEKTKREEAEKGPEEAAGEKDPGGEEEDTL